VLAARGQDVVEKKKVKRRVVERKVRVIEPEENPKCEEVNEAKLVTQERRERTRPSMRAGRETIS
jgi:hypothetical protein